MGCALNFRQSLLRAANPPFKPLIGASPYLVQPKCTTVKVLGPGPSPAPLSLAPRWVPHGQKLYGLTWSYQMNVSSPEL